MTAPNSPRFKPKYFHPTSEQTAIQISQNKVVVIQANAGAAKTTTLAIRIGEAIARGLAPEQILALTFTPEARDVLQRRLIDVGIPPGITGRLRVVTFNEFAAQILEKIEQRKVRQISRIKDLKPYIDQALQDVSDNYGGKLEYLVSDTSTLAISQFFYAQLELKATQRLSIDFSDYTEDEVSDILGVSYSTALTIQEYEKIRLTKSGDVLFRGPFDATYDLSKMLSAGIATRTQLPRSRIILCDELHDLNEAAFSLLTNLIDPNYTYFIGAGDIDQVIHSRLGANESFMRSRFNAEFPSTVSYPLTFSFRHGPHLALAAGEFKRKVADSLLPLRTEIQQRYYGPHGLSCADQVIASVKRWQALDCPGEDCAILVREPHQAIAIENALMREQIPYQTLEMSRYLQREEILFLRGMIAIALDNFSETEKSKRGVIFDAVATFAEVNFSRDENVAQLRQAVVDEPEALNWLFSGRVNERGSKDVLKRVASVVNELMSAERSLEPDLVLGALRQKLASLLDFVQSESLSGADTTFQRALAEVEQEAIAMIGNLERSVSFINAKDLLRMLRNNLLTLQSNLNQLVARDVKVRMSGVIEYLRELPPDTPADLALRYVYNSMNVEALAKRLYIHQHDALVVNKSLEGFIKAAEEMRMNLRQFSQWISTADQYALRKSNKGYVKLDCVRNSKGKEFNHVILPFLEVNEFPFIGANRGEEENLFYVAITRAISSLTLISPSDSSLRSPFISRMKLESSKPRAESALTRNSLRTT